jgi:hypothetical protein
MNNLKLITAQQKLAFCLVSVSPIRNDANDKSEIISQLVFGEPIEVISFGEPWINIRTILDGYEGFVDIKHLLPLTEKEFKKWLNHFIYQHELTNVVQTPWGNQLISRGSLISSESTFKIGDFDFFQRTTEKSVNKNLVNCAKDLLNVPYLWGGKSVFGIDCSGFAQLIFRLFEFNLPRDAYQQAEIGELVEFKDSKSGDIAFFTNANGKIIHVGIIIENSHIIHASGRVRIDQLTESGILNLDYDKETHKLHFIKRILS